MKRSRKTRLLVGILLIAFVFQVSMVSTIPTYADDGFPWDFEDGNAHNVIPNASNPPFPGIGNSKVELMNDFSRGSGTNSIFVSERGTNSAGPMFEITPYIEVGVKYRITAWVYSNHTAATNFRIRFNTGIDKLYGDDFGYRVQDAVSINVQRGQWTQLTAEYRFATNEYTGFYIDTPNTSGVHPSFYVDDINWEVADNSAYQFDTSLTPLKDAYKNYFMIGSIITVAEAKGIRTDFLKYHYDVLTCENWMKPVYLSNAPGVYTLNGAENLLAVTEGIGLLMHGHTLLWHSQSADWLNPAGTTRAQAKANMEEYIKNVAGYFSGRIDSWDVVNEIMGTGTGLVGGVYSWKNVVTNTPWRTAYANGMDPAAGEDSTDFIYDAFVFARKYDPIAKLYYNDFSMDNQNKSTAVAAMVTEYNNRYALEHPEDKRPLVEGVGMQGHYSSTVNINNVESSIMKFIAAGADVSITELDVTITSKTEANLRAQAVKYAELFYLFMKYAENFDRVTFWGLDDGNGWRTTGFPQLFNEDLSAKEAYWAVIDPAGYLGLDIIPPPAAKISLSGPASVVNGPGATAKYTISAEKMPTVSGIELQFELDGDYLGANAFSSDNFDILGEGNYGSPIFWRNDGNKWIGTVTLCNANGIGGSADILDMVFSLKDGILGNTDVKLNYIILSYAGNNVLAEIKNGVVTTTFEKYYLPYDLNKDGVVDLNDITYALQFFMAKEGDANWDAAKVADLNIDGIVDIEDLLFILANYTIPYYSW